MIRSLILLLFCLLNASESQFASLPQAPVQSSFISKWVDNQPSATPLTLQSGYEVIKGSFGDSSTTEAFHCTPMTAESGARAMRQSLKISLQKQKREGLTLGNIYKHLHIFLFPSNWKSLTHNLLSAHLGTKEPQVQLTAGQKTWKALAVQPQKNALPLKSEPCSMKVYLGKKQSERSFTASAAVSNFKLSNPNWNLTIAKQLPARTLTLSSSLRLIGTSLALKPKSIPSCLVVIPHHRSWLEAITFEHNPQHYFLKNLRAHLEQKAEPTATAQISFEKKSPLAVSQTPLLDSNSIRSLIFSNSTCNWMQDNLLAHYENKNAYETPTHSFNFEKKSPLAIRQTPFLDSNSIRSLIFGNSTYNWMQDNLLAHYENRPSYEATSYSFNFEKKSPLAISQTPFLDSNSIRSLIFGNTAYNWMQDNLLAHYENRPSYEAASYSFNFEKKSPIAISQAPFLDSARIQSWVFSNSPYAWMHKNIPAKLEQRDEIKGHSDLITFEKKSPIAMNQAPFINSDFIRSWVFSNSPSTWIHENILAHLEQRGEIDGPSDLITFEKKSPIAINQAPFTAPRWTYALAFEQNISMWLKNNLATYRQDTFATKKPPVRPTPFAASRSFWSIRPWNLANLSVPKAVSFPATETFDKPETSPNMAPPLAVIPGEIPIGLAKPNWQTNPPPQVSSQRAERFPWPKRVMLNHTFGDQADRHVPMASNYSTLGVMLAPDYRPGHFLTFGDLRAHYIDNNTYSGNIGIGTRYIPDGSTGFCHMIGLNLYYDCRQGSLGYFQQIGAGLEILGRRWDLRANVYGPIGKRPRICSCMFDEYIGDYFAVRHDIESVSNSFNAEFGYLFINGKSFSLYAAAGPYFLTRGRCVNNAIGIEGRIQPKYKDYLTLNFIGRYDQIFGRILQAEISLSIPLYEFRKRNLRPCGLRNWQIYQPVQRFEVMPLSQKSCWETNF